MSASADWPAILMPNDPAYGAGARAAGCEQIYLPTTVANVSPSDLDALDDATLRRLRSSSPAGQSARLGRLALISSARRNSPIASDLAILSDECYSKSTPRKRRAARWNAPTDFSNVVAFQSLSKRSNCRACGSASWPATRNFSPLFTNCANAAAPQVPMPLQHVAVAAYSDETHVEEKLKNCTDQVRSRRPESPVIASCTGWLAGGFCAWLDVSECGGDEAVTDSTGTPACV